MKLPPGIDPDQLTIAAEAARRAQEIEERMPKHVRRAAADAAQLAADALRFVPLVPPLIAQVRTVLDPIMDTVRGAIRDGLAAIPDIAREALKWKELIERLPEETRRMLESLGKHGWYPDVSGMTKDEIMGFADALEEGDPDVHDRLCEHFEERMDGILEEIVEHYPQRAKIVASAFAAHRRGEYELSIPALLAQTDGICREQAGVQLCQRENGQLALVAVVDSWGKSDLSKSMLHSLLVILPIAYNEKQRDGLSGILNRHAVLHGEDTEYGTRPHGCRAISLICYVAAMLRDQEPEEEVA